MLCCRWHYIIFRTISLNVDTWITRTLLLRNSFRTLSYSKFTNSIFSRPINPISNLRHSRRFSPPTSQASLILLDRMQRTQTGRETTRANEFLSARAISPPRGPIPSRLRFRKRSCSVEEGVSAIVKREKERDSHLAVALNPKIWAYPYILGLR